jgi:predicted GIY-YIG superfamily endonuclease
MTFWAYMLHCRGGAFYVGHTDNLEYRIGQHQSGLIAGFTANHLPVELVWSQEFATRHEAKTAEKQIKGWSRAKKMALIRGDWGRISTLAKGKYGPSTSSGQTGVTERVVHDRSVISRRARPEPVGLEEGAKRQRLSFSLLCHPLSPPRMVRAVHVEIVETKPVRIEYRVEGAQLLQLPDLVSPTRADELWRTTCFELFVKSSGADRYTEYNFSPSSAWAAYAFESYRADMRNAPMREPGIIDWYDEISYELFVERGPILPLRPIHLAISAVIEEVGGTKSYWALAHPPDGPPDFHHRDCFALHLPAPDGA